MSLQRKGNKKKSIRHFQFYFLVQGAHLMALTRIQKTPISYRLNTILQEKKIIFLPNPYLDFSGKCSCFRTLRHITNDPTPGTNGSRVSLP
jgi:hypothetical protein